MVRGGNGKIGAAIAYGLALGIALVAIQEAIGFAGSEWGRDWAFGNGDLNGYLDGARRFLETGSPYAPWTGLGPHTFIHPPVALALFVPFLWLPAVLWWAIPMAGTAYLIARSRTSAWRWVGVALCLAWPRSVGAILAGNSDIWAMFIVAIGVRYRWPVALLAIKPTFAPLGIIGIRDPKTWIAGAGLLVVSLPLLPQWIALVTRIDGGLWYSLGGLPLVALPLLRSRPDLHHELAVSGTGVQGHGPRRDGVGELVGMRPG